MQTSTHPVVSVPPPLTHYQPSLNVVHDAMRAGEVAIAMEDLFEDLSLRREEEPQTWPHIARSCLRHPLRHLLHQDPFTYHAFAKPRGYAGDAVMMDYIYGLGEADGAMRDATPMGRSIFRHMATRPSARAVRYRRELLANLIDDT